MNPKDIGSKKRETTEHYLCQSYVDDNNELQDCTCGKCGDKKDCMFQYADQNGHIYEDTGLITRREADKLVEKWLPHLIEHWNEFHGPQFGIWINCETPTNYHTMGLDIDFRDCELVGGHFYRVKKEKVL